MTSKIDASHCSTLALYKALSTMGLFAILLLGLLDILVDDKMSEALHPGIGFHPASFGLFVLVVTLSGKRQGLGLSYFPKPVWDYLARATTVFLVLLTLLRGYEHFTGNVFVWLEPILGALGLGCYTSFWTLAGLTALHWLDVHCPHNPSQYRRWFSYALFFSVVSLCLHQLSDVFLDNGHYRLDGLSAISAAWLLAFAAFLFPRTVAYKMLFDPRAPKADIISAAGLVIALSILALVEASAPYPGVALSLSAFLLLALPIVISVFRPLEIEARIARGEIDEDGASLAFVPAPRSLDVQANTATELSALERGVSALLFSAADWQRYGLQAGLTFLLAYGAILLSRTAESDIATLWWANAFLAINLLLQKDDEFIKTLTVFGLALVAANVFTGNTLKASVLFTVINATEGALIGIMARTVFGIRNTGFSVTITNFSIPRFLFGSALAMIIVGVTSLLGSAIITLGFDAGVFDNVAPWFLGASVGTFTLMPLAGGLVFEVGQRYQKLPPKIPYLGPISIAYTLGVFAFYAFVPTNGPLPVPHMVFILISAPLVMLPSLQLAGAFVFYNSTVYYTFVLSRWVGDGPVLQVPFLIMLIPLLITMAMVTRHQYARRQRAEQRALDFAPNALITLDDEGRVLSISKNAQEWFEVDAATLYGRRLLDFFENKKALSEEFEKYSQSTPSVTFEAKAIRRLSTGQELAFSGTIRGNQDSSLPYSYVVSLLDITKEHELEKEKAQLIDRSKSVILVQDMQWNTLQCSDAWVAFTGYSREETLASDFHDFLHPEDLERARDERNLLLEDGSKTEGTTTPYRLVTKSGDIKLIKLRTMLEDKSEGGRFVMTLVDITELVAAQSFNEQLLDRSRSIILTEQRDHKVVTCSEAWIELIGYSREETVGSDLASYLIPEQVEHFNKSRAKFLTGEYDDGNWTPTFVKKDGTLVYTKLNVRTDLSSGEWRVIYTIQDVTELVAARSFNEALLDKSPAIILTENKKFKIQSCSEAWVRRMGYSREETVGREFVEFFAPEQRDIVRRARAKLRDGTMDEHDFSGDLLDKHGDVMHIRMNARVDTSGGGWRLILTVTDITELEQHRRYTDTLLNRNSSIILTQGEDWKVLSCSQAWVDQLGYSREETVGHDLVEFMHPEDAEVSRTFRETNLRRLQSKSVIKNTLRFMTKSGEERIIKMQSVIEEIDGDWHNILTLVDITEIMQTQDQLAYMVEHDELTGLLSRRGMQHRFSDTNRVEDKALYVFDIDHFKSVNDCFGHEAGDALLRTLSKTMSRLSDADGDAIRLGGDEFAVIRPWYGWEDATHFGETLRQALNETKVTWNDRDIHRAASIGFAPLHMTDRLTDVLHLADILAREAKTTGRNQVLGATEVMMEDLRKRGVFIRADEIQAALENGEMHYEVQPIWNMEQGAIEGFEALIRWDKPDGTRVIPSLFIELFYEVMREKTYFDLKTQMRRDCLAKLSAFPTQYVSFNYIMEQLGYEGAAQDIIEQLESVKDHAEREIVIEISERAMAARVDTALLRKEMTTLQDAGYKIALDDFGVESSNLNRLQVFPISIVKIDKALISNITTSPIQRAMLRGLTFTFKALDTKIIVEGVETEQQADVLFIAGLYSHQGYLHARPMPPQEVEPNLANIGKTTLASELSEQQRKKDPEPEDPALGQND